MSHVHPPTENRPAVAKRQVTSSYPLGPLFVAALVLATAGILHAADPVADPLRRVGPSDDASSANLPNAQTIAPAGKSILFAGRPLDLCLSPDRSTLYVKNNNSLAIFDAKSWKLRQTLPIKGDFASMHGLLAVGADHGATLVYFTCANQAFLEARTEGDGTTTWTRRLNLPGPDNTESHPLGIALSPNRATAYVCLSRNNTLAVIDLLHQKIVSEIPVGVCPYEVVLAADGRAAYVTNFGGSRPANGAMTADSAGTAVAVDEHGFAISGTVSRVDLGAAKEVREIAVGLHPAQIVLTKDGRRAFVANANADSVSVIDTEKDAVVQTIATSPRHNSLFGSITNALALDQQETHLFAANAGDNAVALIDLAGPAGPTVRGFIPTGWFPGAVVCDGSSLFVANTKGDGSRTYDDAHKAWNSLRLRGSVTKIDLPHEAQLDKYSEQVRDSGRGDLPDEIVANAGGSAAATPVPQHVEQPSVLHHVIYVLKENRTYDQVLGDLPRGNGDSRLCIYGQQVTPNAHAIAGQFALLDNYYCNGVRSADGHQWATQGIVTDYQEKDLSGSVRSYDFGTDALCFAPTPFIWDALLLGGRSVRNYGEFSFPLLKNPSHSWFDNFADANAGRVIPLQNNLKLRELVSHTAPDYPGWHLAIPDTYRVRFFIDELKEFEKSGQCPNFMLVYLPQDHTNGASAGSPAPRAMVADNDLALGRLVEAVSHSRFWRDTCIFVNEDDPQNGFDHVDGHRSICLVISPYARHNAVVSRFYNQTSVLHTIARIFGIRPMNQQTAQAPTMEDCFTDNPDLTPYESVPNQIALDEPNPPRHAHNDDERHLLEKSAQMRWTYPDQNDDDTLNRLLWLASREGEPYPAGYAGTHGRGLKSLGLTLEASHPGKDDD